MALEVVIRCKACGEEVGVPWELDETDPETNVCEIAGDLDFDHTCPGAGKEQADEQTPA